MEREPSFATDAFQPGRVSFVIASYDSAKTLPATLESCLSQTYPDCEVIVVDDGSRDDTLAILRGYGERVRVISKRNGGLPSARNAGTRAASGEFIAWMDADDLCHPDRARIGAGVLREYEDVLLVSSDFSAFTRPEEDFEASHMASYYRAIREAGGVAPLYGESSRCAQADGLVVHRGGVYERLVEGNFVHPPTVMVRREAFARAGFFDESLRTSCDYDMILRLARLGPFAHVDAPLLRYRRSATQMSHGSAGGRIPLDTVQILDKVAREDPGIARRMAPMLRRRRAQALVEAAEMMVYSAPGQAFVLLLRSLPHRPAPKPVLRTLGKLVLPRGAIRTVRRLLGQSPPDKAPIHHEIAESGGRHDANP